MDNIAYLILIIILTIFIVFYGGHNNQNRIEYNTFQWNNLDLLNFLSINHLTDTNKYFQMQNQTQNYYKISDKMILTDNFLPNFVDCYLIKIESKKIFNIDKIISLKEHSNNLMILINNYNNIKLELLVEYKNNLGYFYILDKKISIVSIYDILNNSNETCFIYCIIVKKPYWFH